MGKCLLNCLLLFHVVFSFDTIADDGDNFLRSSGGNLIDRNDMIEADGYQLSKVNENPTPNRVRIDTLQLNEFYQGRKRLEGIDQLNSTKVTWSNVVIYLLTFNSKQPNRLLQAQFNTWIKLVNDEGLDIVIVTDEDDERTYDEILPDANNVKPTIHLYKSPAKKEGALTRAKSVDAMSYIYKNFIKNKKGGENVKQYFLKVDSDTLVIPENLMLCLQKLDGIVSLLPADFGKVNCFAKEQDICYTAGGFYGMNAIGFEASYRYIQSHPSMYNEQIVSFLNGQNLNAHEDFFISYAFRKATGYPAINIIEMGEKIMGRHQIGIHKAKPVAKYYKYYEAFYDEDGKARPVLLES